MTVLGWLLLAASLSFVWGLAGFCYYMVLTLPEGQEVPEEVTHFHSA